MYMLFRRYRSPWRYFPAHVRDFLRLKVSRFQKPLKFFHRWLCVLLLLYVAPSNKRALGTTLVTTVAGSNRKCWMSLSRVQFEISKPEATGHFLLPCVGTGLVMRRCLLAVLQIMYKCKISTLKKKCTIRRRVIQCYYKKQATKLFY